MKKNIDGIIFNIQKFSINDGPGIRTVVFFKGCPLKCQWCANPESQDTKVQILWDEKNAHKFKSKGEIKTVDEIMKIVLQDLPFYEESGGGVTLSGGEALMQPEFALALLKELKSKNIHTAIETTGFVSHEIFQHVIKYSDLLLFDIKHWNESKHKEKTGVSNVPILKNMKYAVEIGKEVLPRLPVIPNYNDSLEDAENFIKCLKQVGLKRIQLLPFHQFGENKYKMLGRKYFYSGVKALHPEDLKNFQKIFIDNEIEAFF